MKWLIYSLIINNIILIINKKNNNGDYTVNCAAINNNVKMSNILIEYANKHHIILKLNEQNEKEVSTFTRYYK